MFSALAVRFSSFTLWLAMEIINRTVRFELVGGEHIDRFSDRGVILAFWHQSSFPLFFFYRRRFRGRKPCIFAADSRRGAVITGVGKRYRFRVVHVPMGTDSKKGARSILLMIKALKESYDAIVATDGPRGPARKAKPGIIYLAQKTGSPILPIGVCARFGFKLPWRWDHYLFPLPFTRLAIKVGVPLFVEDNNSASYLEEKRKELEEKIEEANNQAVRFFK